MNNDNINNNKDNSIKVKTFGEKLKEERLKKGISQKELGERMGVSQAMIAQYENGKRTPKQDTIMKICKSLDMNIRDTTTILLSFSTLFSRRPVSDMIKYIAPLYYDNDDEFYKKLTSPNLSEEDKEDAFRIMYESIMMDDNEIISNLVNTFSKLNTKGKEKAIEQVEMLTKIEEYTKKEPKED